MGCPERLCVHVCVCVCVCFGISDKYLKQVVHDTTSGIMKLPFNLEDIVSLGKSYGFSNVF